MHAASTERVSGRTLRQLSAILAGASSQGAAAFTALSNHQQALNGAPIPPGGGPGSVGTGQVTWNGVAAITALVSGKILVMAEMFATTSVVDDSVQFVLVRDAGGVEAIIGPIDGGSAGHVSPGVSGTIMWIDTVVVGSTHSYSIRGQNNTGGHTIQVAALAEASVTAIELPG